MALAGASIVWAVAVSVGRGGDPSGSVLLVVAAAVAVAGARLLTTPRRPAGPAAVVIAGAVLLLASVGAHTRGPGLPFGLPFARPKTPFPPLLYPNANGAFFVQAAAASLALAVVRVRAPLRVAGVAGAVLFAGAAVLSGSLAATITLVVVGAAAAASMNRLGARVAVAGSAAIFLAVLIATLVVASSGEGRIRPSERAATQRLGGMRIDLWRQAYATMAERPVVGVGAGRFAEATDADRFRAARGRDRDLLWAHNEFLQQGAEGGIPGLLLLLGLFGWGFARLAVGPADRLTGVAAGSLAALGMHASVDYILHFPLIPLAAAAVLGTAQASRDRAEPRPGPLVRKTVKAAVLPVGLFSRRRAEDVAILLYHRVGAGDREIDVPVEAFEEQMAELAARERLLRLDDLTNGGGRGGVVVTFDDGQRDFHEHALPVLVRHRVPAVLYLATSWVENGAVEDALSWTQLREALDTGLVDLGSHTHDHRDLSSATEQEAEEEMRRSREAVEDRLGAACSHFSYPWGVASEGADRVARRLFDTAVLAWGTNRGREVDLYRLGRLPVLRSDGRRFFRAKVRGMLDHEASAYRLVGRGPWRMS